MSTPPYVAPQLTANGPVVPSFLTYQATLVQKYLSIYPANASLTASDADYQWISAVALMFSDLAQFGAAVLNAFGLFSNSGVGQDAQYANLGIQRLPATASTVSVTLTGTSGTVITNGTVYDTAGNVWNLPASVTIGVSGNVTVTATAQNTGPITAAANTVTGIGTPTAGWTGVTNAAQASPGTDPETDAAFRARAVISTLLPSQTTFNATLAAVAAVAGVTRSTGYNNPNDTTDSYGNPPHSITMVVQGGEATAIAQAIYDNYGLGADTNGTTTVNVTDSQSGQVQPISFDIATETTIYVTLNVAALAQPVTSATETAIQNAIVSYLNSLNIGQVVSIAALYATAMGQAGNLAQPNFSVITLYAGTTPSPTGTSDVVIAFDAVATCVAADVIVNVVAGP